MKSPLIAERYARALNDTLPEDALAAAVDAMDAVSALYQQSADLRSALSHPGITVESRLSLLHEVLAAEDVSDRVRHLLDLLLRRGRMALLPDVAELFSAQVDLRLNRIGANVRTATPLDEGHRARLAQVLERYFNKTIRMKCVVDPTILGGVVARVGGVVLDGSVRSRLERLRAELLSREQ